MRKSQQVMANMFAAVLGMIVCCLAGAVLGYFVADFSNPPAPNAPDSDYLQWWAYSFDSLVRHSKAVLSGGGIGGLAGAVGGYLLNRRVAWGSSKTPTG